MLAVRPCSNCGESCGEEFGWTLCDHVLCARCAGGVVHACPVCGAHRLLDPSRAAGDWSGWQWVFLLFGFAAVLYGLAR